MLVSVFGNFLEKNLIYRAGAILLKKVLGNDYHIIFWTDFKKVYRSFFGS